MLKKMCIATVGVFTLFTGSAAISADMATYEAAMSAAKSAVATAAAAGGEWRDTGALMKAAETAAKAGDYAKAVSLTETARQQALTGAQQANEEAGVGNPAYLY